jgi:hypothetical protein
MTDETAPEKPRGDQMTTDFFETVLTTYLEEDRIESGVLRLDLDDGRTRRLVIDDESESLDPYEYLQRELAEVIYLIEENEDLLDEPVELSIPVGDTERVIEEAEQDEAVTTMFRASGIQTVLEHLHAVVSDDQERAFEENDNE